MKKTLFFLILFGLAASSYAQNISNRFLFIEGTAENEEHLEFFLEHFTIEARTSGYTIPKRKREAAHTFSFSVSPNVVVVNGVERPAPPGDSRYILKISLINNKNNEESLSFDFFFTELIETYEYIQLLFNRATVYIPAATVDQLVDRRWQNKWLYLRASFDYPIVFNALQPKGLKGGQAAYGDPFDISQPLFYYTQRLDHKIQPQPGLTVGLEFQFLNFMSLEGIFKINMGDTSTYSFVNMSTGGHLMFPIKTKYLTIQPYLAYNYHLNISPLYSKFPRHAFGAGLQFAARGGKPGAFFIDVNYMHTFGDVALHNPPSSNTPNPTEIYYKRFVIGLGVGYKFGFVDRKPRIKTPKTESAPAE